ncbi:MAG: FUSC family protein [Enhydrobacter sp.]|nr:FUSC family protein [Enhydrobacter sp.]
MIRPVLRSVAGDVSAGLGSIGRILRLLGQEIWELAFDTSRWRQCLMAALVVPLAVTMALMLHLDSVWWAGISGFMTVLATGSASFKRGLVRVGGTLVGVVVAFVLARWLPYDHLALTLFLAAATFLGTVAMVVSPHGMAWLLATVTVNIVLLASLDDPLQVLHIAFNRLAEVAVGVTASTLVTNLIVPGGESPAGPAAPGWRSLLGDERPVLLQGLRSAVVVVILLYVWIWLELPQFEQMAITVTVVMAAPGAGGVGLAGRHAVAERALHRLIGCLVGGLVALACLALSVTAFLPWLAMLSIAMWICMHVQTSPRGVGYVGTQAALVFIVTLVQSAGPPSSIMPGVDRFAGITGGLAILLIVSVALWPGHDERHGHG